MASIQEALDHERPPTSHFYSWRIGFRSIVQLFKLRIVLLLLLAALGGAFLGAGGWPGIGAIALLLLTGGMSASGASALNQYIERESDKVMHRTRLRPLATRSIAHPTLILVIGVLLIAVPVIFVWPFNPALSFFLLLGAMIYVIIYTIWLKPRSILNIVIGGAAGSAAVMSGGAAVANWQNTGVIALALLLFLWTPAHFWSLAVVYRRDYQRAELPMLPAQISIRHAAFWITLHMLGTGFVAIMLGMVPELSWLYWVPITLVTGEMLRRCFRLMRQPATSYARSLFIGSNLYLMLILVMICVDTLVRSIV